MNELDQAKNIIEKSRTVLILPSQELDGDVLASSLALFSTLKKIGKNVNVLIDEIPEKFRFLETEQPKIPNDFIISVDASNKEISKMRYEKDNDGLKIYLTLNKGEIKTKDISFPFANEAPDLLITLGVESLENLGDFFEHNSQLFRKAPILNIDNHLSNEGFGEVNLVDTTLCLAEILTSLIRFMESEDEAFLDENIATCLLTGIICASQNFRNPKTQPKTFETSAYLITRGGNHQKIIQHLYKQKSVSQVNLLGKVLEKMSFDEPKELYIASLAEKDFQDCQSSSRDLSFVIEELKSSFKYLPNLLILWENHTSPALTKGVFYSEKKNLIEKVLQNYEGVSKGEGALFLIREGNLDLAKENLLKII